MKYIRRPIVSDSRPEFAGRVITSTQPLTDDERLSLWRIKQWLNEHGLPWRGWLFEEPL